ncbi:MAG: GNAT family N-acetyltransferase [Anaerolineae bacterium]
MADGWLMRPYAGDEDYWRLRAFLRQVYRLNHRQERSWPVCRWDCCHWHVYPTAGDGSPEASVLLWEHNGALIAAAISEGWGDVWLQVHPAWRDEALERTMVTAAEEHLSAPRGDGRALTVWAHADDPFRKGVLRARGYVRGQEPEYDWWRDLDDGPDDLFLAGLDVPEGYAVRSLGGPEEIPARSHLSWLAFSSGASDSLDPAWYAEQIQRAPLYRRDLDLVAVAPDGSLAGFATVWFDDVNRSASFEPVGVAPGHRRRGVGRALMAEGLRRARSLGATRAHVGSFSPAAQALYVSVGFTRYLLAERWEKSWE